MLQQPIGLSPDNRPVFYDLFDGWSEELSRDRPDVDPERLRRMRERFYGGDFVFSVTRSTAAACPVPLLVLRGDDVYHPSAISEEIVRLAPRAELIAEWKTPPFTALAVERLRAFLRENTSPSGGSDS